MVALNYERIQYWMAKGANLSDPVAELLGLCNQFTYDCVKILSTQHFNFQVLQAFCLSFQEHICQPGETELRPKSPRKLIRLPRTNCTSIDSMY